jgi:membrane-bound lytic murein transglycosylase D
MQIRKLANTLLVSVICFFSVALMSFTGNGRTKTSNGARKDSSNASKGFDDVFSSLPGSRSGDGNLLSVPLNPSIISFVKSFIGRESDDYSSMKNWGKSYFSLFDKILSKYNIPCQLKYLAVIESSLQPSMVSTAGAVGPWQIMPDEAKEYGLRTGKSDERKDFTKSTTVAAKMLSKLYDHFGDWLLVIAAYNAGEGRVRQAIRKSGSTSFWAIQNFLPAETRNHVKKFIATHYYFEGCGGVTTLTTDELKEYMPIGIPKIKIDDLENTAVVEIEGRYNSTIMAKYLQMDEGFLDRLNPGLDDALNSGSTYNLRLPTDKIDLFSQTKKVILKESVEGLLLNAETVKK